MSSPRPLVPVEVVARARSHGRIPFGFGARFFVALLLGLLWLIPAWWAPRLIDAMFVWDALIFAMFLTDLLRLPKPPELEVRRVWEHPPALATTGEVTVAITNFGAADIRCALVDETPASFRAEPPSLL